MDKAQILQLTEKSDYLKSKIFCRGFLITDRDIDVESYPFYGNWHKTEVGNYTVMTHPLQTLFLKSGGGVTVGLIGHAYNIITGDISEDKIVEELLKRTSEKDSFFSSVNELTGVFCIFVLFPDKLILLNDAVSLQTVFFTENAQSFYAASHTNLISDLAGFKEDDYITRLKKCRTFSYFGNQLPGNLTSFREVKRMIPNHYLKVDGQTELIRFYYPHTEDLDFKTIVSRTCEFLKKTMRLISEKWDRPAISLTGGCDSKTTLAGANGLYDKFLYFSYDSQPNEVPDAEAAVKICKELGLPHIFYHIPYSDDEFENIDDIRKILIWNGGDVRDNNPNDVRKRAFLDKQSDFDVEVKSWASEISRARYSKRYMGKRSFGKKPTPRKCTTFYKYLTNRKIVNETDKVFRDYIDKYFLPDSKRPIAWQDQLYWEWHWPSRDGVTLVCEHMFSDLITIPYNNRIILTTLLSASFEDRYKDSVYTAVRNELDSRIDAASGDIVDVNHTKARALKERAYYRLNVLLPY